MKKLFSSLISTMLILGFLHQGKARTNVPSTERREAIRFAPRQIREANRKRRYTIQAKYPQAIGAKDPRLERLNQAIRSMITEQVDDFKKDYQPPDKPMGNMLSYFDSDYKVELANNDLVSINFGINTYGEGAAHPNHYSLVFNYSFETGKTLMLSDLFKPNSNYLSLVSNYAINSLKKELGPDPDSDWIERGAGASEENYKNWNITAKGLKVTFDPYQVASYAEGPHEVIIPYSVLKSVIEPDGPLSKMKM